MIQNSIDRTCIPTFVFSLALRAKNEWEKNVNLDNFCKLSELTQSVMESGIIFAGAENFIAKQFFVQQMLLGSPFIRSKNL